MADKGTPHFHNDPGVPVIHVGSKEFMCIGATPPFDHPHVFLDMGYDDRDRLLLLLDPVQVRSSLKADEARPAECCGADHARHGSRPSRCPRWAVPE